MSSSRSMQPRPRTPSESARAVRAQPGPRAREDDGDRRLLGVRDPDLAAGDAIAVARLDRPRLLIGGVGAGVGFGERERADGRPGRERAQPFLALLVAPRVRDYFRDERV